MTVSVSTAPGKAPESPSPVRLDPDRPERFDPELIVVHYRLILHRARRMTAGYPWLEAEDVAQEAAIVAIIRRERYDFTRGRVQHFLGMCVRYVVGRYTRKNEWRQKSIAHVTAWLTTPDGKALSLIETTPDERVIDPPEACERREELATVNAALDRLRAFDRDTIERRFGINGHAPAAHADIDPAVKAPAMRMRLVKAMRAVREELGVEPTVNA